MGRRWSWLVVVLLLASSPARANAGPPWLLTGLGATFLVPALLALAEGRLLARLAGGSAGRCQALLMVANYGSALAGWSTIGVVHFGVAALPPSWVLRGYWLVVAAVVAVAYGATVALEWPWYRLAWPVGARSWRLSGRVCARLNLASYAVLAPWFWLLTSAGLVRQTRYEPDLAYLHDVAAWVYHLQGESLWRCRLDGSSRQEILALPADWRRAAGQGWALAAVATPGSTHLQLWVIGYHHPPRRLLDRLPGYTVATPSVARQFASSHHAGHTLILPPVAAQAADLRAPEARNCQVRTGFWAEDGLRVDWPDGRLDALSLGSPVVQWRSSAPSILPGDRIVWQLDRQLAVLDLRTRRLSLIGAGTSPVVVLDNRHAPPIRRRPIPHDARTP